MEDYHIKMEAAMDDWLDVPPAIQQEVERYFDQAKDGGFELAADEVEWRRVGVARGVMEAKEDEGNLGSITRAGIKNFPQFVDGGEWESYLRDFEELVEPTRPAYLRIRLLRQVVGPETKRRVDAYLMPAVLYSDFNEYVKDATLILRPPGGVRQAKRKAIRCIQRIGEKGRAWLERFRKAESQSIRGTNMTERFDIFHAACTRKYANWLIQDSVVDFKGALLCFDKYELTKTASQTLKRVLPFRRRWQHL
jgi:hypothetical protein